MVLPACRPRYAFAAPRTTLITRPSSTARSVNSFMLTFSGTKGRCFINGRSYQDSAWLHIKGCATPKAICLLERRARFLHLPRRRAARRFRLLRALVRLRPAASHRARSRRARRETSSMPREHRVAQNRSARLRRQRAHRRDRRAQSRLSRWRRHSRSPTFPRATRFFFRSRMAWAEVLECSDIFIGVNAIDYSGYPDCRPEFIDAFEHMANLATKAGVEGRTHLRIHTPLAH